MSSHQQIDYRGQGDRAIGFAALRQAEDVLNVAIAAYGINSGEAFAAQAHVNEVRRRLQQRR